MLHAELKKKHFKMNVEIGNVLEYRDDVDGKIYYGWVVEPTTEISIFFEVQVIDQHGDPVLKDGMVVEGMITLGQIEKIFPSLDHFKAGVLK
jgi:hypothetical protein